MIMNELYVRDIVKLCGGRIINGNEELILGNFCTDSRKINKGDVYLAIMGDNFDGNDFYVDAIKNGASCCILSKDVDCGNYKDCTIILVDDTLKCVQELAKYKRSLYDIPVIAITGSAGKTSTKDIIYSVVSRKYKTHKTMGNYNNHLGLPLTILGLRDHEALVVEMGMNHLGEISLLSEIAKPTISVITNVGTAHIGILGSRENILKAKLEILDGMIGKDVIINNDNDMLNSVVDELKDNYKVHTVSIDNYGDYKAVNLEEDVFSSKFDIENEIDDVNIDVGGKVYIYNSLMAYAVGCVLDIDNNLIKAGILEFKLTSGRLEKKINNKGVIVIDDTYNANYDSMKSSIELLGKVKDKRKIVILGDMLELGEYTEELHSKIGNVVVDNRIDILVVVGEYSKLIREKAIELGFKEDNIYQFEYAQEVSDDLLNSFTDEDIVLVKGSHGIKLFLVVDKIMNL